MSRAKFDREVAEYLALDADYRDRGWFLVKAEWPHAIVLLASKKTVPPAIVTAVQFDYTNYDAEPPSVLLVDPFSGRPLLSRELPTQLPRMIPGPEAVLPDGTRMRLGNPQNLMQAYSPDDVPFLCLPGVKAYHDHPGHTGDSWELHRPRRRGSTGSPVGGDRKIRRRAGDGLQRQPGTAGHVRYLRAPRVTLRGVRRFRIQASAVRETEEAIRSAGLEGYELFVVWSGTRDGDTFAVAEVHVPRQVSYKLDDGLCVTVDGPELHRLNVWLYEARQVVGVQIHSHPGRRLSLGDRRHLPDRHTGRQPIDRPALLRPRRLRNKRHRRLPPRWRRLARTNRSSE